MFIFLKCKKKKKLDIQKNILRKYDQIDEHLKNPQYQVWSPAFYIVILENLRYKKAQPKVISL